MDSCDFNEWELGGLIFDTDTNENSQKVGLVIVDLVGVGDFSKYIIGLFLLWKQKF